MTASVLESPPSACTITGPRLRNPREGCCAKSRVSGQLPISKAIQPSSIRKPTLPDYGKLTLLGAIWGASFLLLELALEGFPPITIATVRIALAGIIMLAITRVRGERMPRDPRVLFQLVALGALSTAVPFFLISWGQQYISGGATAILMSSGTFVALILSHFLTPDDRITWVRLAGLIVGFGGVVVLMGANALGDSTGVLAGQCAVVLAATSYVVSSLLVRNTSGVPVFTVSAVSMISASVYLVPLALFFDRPWTLSPTPLATIALIVLALVPTAYAFWLRFSVIRVNGAVFMSQVGYLIPLFGVFWGWLFLDEIVGPSVVLALLMILVGIHFSRIKRS